MKKLLSLILILTITAGGFFGCKKDKGDPPALPPASSMTIDFSNFIEQKKSANSFTDLKGTESSNWDEASRIAGIWHLLINTTLIVPVTAFKIAVDQDPVYIEDKTWQWSFSTTVGGVTYNARLTGQIGASVVTWKMYISGSFAEFVWFQGTSNLDGTGGQWILNESSQNPSAFLQIDWTKTSSTVGTIKYTYVKNDSFKNSYIEYGLTTGTYDAFYNVHYVYNGNFSDVDIEWNTSTHNGRIRSSDYLQGDWYYWDANKINSLPK